MTDRSIIQRARRTALVSAIGLLLGSSSSSSSSTLSLGLVVHVDGYTFMKQPLRVVSSSYKAASHTRLFGILDDMVSTENDNQEAPNNEEISNDLLPATDNKAFETLFFDLVFSERNTRHMVERRLEECTDTGFLNYLQTQLQAVKDDDDEERAALQDLMKTIAEVQEETVEAAAAAAEKQVDNTVEEMVEEISDTNTSEKLSAADILRRAAAIDRAVSTTPVSDDEKPADFMRDCREVANLSKGFNNRGQMRVGGR